MSESVEKAPTRRLHRRVVVGVDGSRPSRSALAWAASAARCFGSTLVVLHAWQFSPLSALAGGPLEVEEYRRAAKKLVDDLIEEVLGSPGEPVIERLVVEGPAAAALLEHSGPGDLVVVGTRGSGGFRGLLLGSVSHQVTHHARCPVVVVPPTDDPEGVEPGESGERQASGQGHDSQ